MKDNQMTSTFSQAEYDAIFDQQRKSQSSHLNALCKKASYDYGQMAHLGKQMHENQQNLEKKEEEQGRLYKAKDLLLKDSEQNNCDSSENRLRRLAYYLLPILDTIFAWFALRPIMIAKLVDYGEGFAEILGMVLAVVVGYFVSMISRMAMSSIDEDSWRKSPRVLGSIIILPMTYIMSELVFNGGNSWAYSVCFAFTSLVIQAIIVGGYHSQIKARDMKKSRSYEIKKTIKLSERVLKKEIKKLQEEAKEIKKDFKVSLDAFSDKYRDIVAEYESYRAEYGKSIFIPIGNDARYLGNAICFQREALPIYHTEEITFSKDLQYISYMYNEIGAKISLDEYLDTERRQEAAPPPQENEQVA